MISEFLFWAHVSLVSFALASGFFLSLPIIVLLALIHQIHLFLFKGCVFTKLENSVRRCDLKLGFVQEVFHRATGNLISCSKSRKISYIMTAFPITIALVRII